MYRALVIFGLLLATQTGFCQHNQQQKCKPLTDAMMDRVTAAGVSASASDGVISFQGQVPTKNGLVSSNGTLTVQTAPLSSTTTTGTLNLSGSAQQNLSSLININAVNSVINVLLNLNINVDSTVGSILQSNLNGKH